MKKLLCLIIILSSLSLTAQQRGEMRNDLSKEEMATLHAERLSMQLDLNAEQKEKLKALFMERMEAREKLQEEKNEMRAERRQFNEKQKADLKEILTEEQYTKWEGLQEKRRKGLRKMKAKRQN